MSDELLPGLRAGDKLGAYVLEGFLGRGGMGAVLSAVQPSLGRRVALKVLPEELARDPDLVRRFESEARALAALAHPNVVQVIEKNVDAGRHFLVMELVEGTTVRAKILARTLAPRDALLVGASVADALACAHGHGLVHRDVKPQNILLARDGTAKLADFGLARALEAPGGERLTATNMVLGTPDYMAPEQREHSKGVDHRADLYALGVVLYEMLTGELPLGRFEPPSRRAELPFNVDDLVLRLLEKDPERRPATAADVARLLRERLGALADPRGETVVVAAPPAARPPATTKRWALLVVLFALLAAGAAGAAWWPPMRGSRQSLLVAAGIFAALIVLVGVFRRSVEGAIGRLGATAEGARLVLGALAFAGAMTTFLPWSRINDLEHEGQLIYFTGLDCSGTWAPAAGTIVFGLLAVSAFAARARDAKVLGVLAHAAGVAAVGLATAVLASPGLRITSFEGAQELKGLALYAARVFMEKLDPHPWAGPYVQLGCGVAVVAAGAVLLWLHEREVTIAAAAATPAPPGRGGRTAIFLASLGLVVPAVLVLVDWILPDQVQLRIWGSFSRAEQTAIFRASFALLVALVAVGLVPSLIALGGGDARRGRIGLLLAALAALVTLTAGVSLHVL